MYLIGQLAKAAGINVETIRYYQRLGLVEQPQKPLSGFRRYPVTTLNQLRFIKRAQELGFTLEQINNLLMLEDAPCHQVQEMALIKQQSVRRKIADLQRLEAVLNQLLNQCSSNSDEAHCPIINSLLLEIKKDKDQP